MEKIPEPAPRAGVLRADFPSPLGVLRLESEGDALLSARFTKEEPRFSDRSPVLDAALRWLERYFAGEDPGETPPLAPAGTAFRRAVWALLAEIPYGETVSYGALARRYAAVSGRRTSARAVGQAVGANPVALFLPCHRVLGASGALTGYAWGVARKKALLALEGVRLPPL